MESKNLYRIISVITARGGSKALPGKNIIPLGGKPLLAHTVEASLNSKYIHTTVVSTDYENIRQVAIDYGAEAPFLRPAEFATDQAHSSDVVEHAISYYEKELNKNFEISVMLQPTSPFRMGQHIDESIEKFLEDPTLDSLISVKKQGHPPWWMFKAEDNRLTTAFKYETGENVFNLERQQFPTVYVPNGAIYVTWRKYLSETGNIVNPDNNGFYLMKDEDSIDIDSRMDLALAELRIGQRE